MPLSHLERVRYLKRMSQSNIQAARSPGEPDICISPMSGFERNILRSLGVIRCESVYIKVIGNEYIPTTEIRVGSLGGSRRTNRLFPQFQRLLA